MAEAIVRGRAARLEADGVADDLLGLDGRAAERGATILQAFEDRPLVPAFAVQLVQRLRDQDPAVTPALPWLDARLAAQGTTADDIVRVEHQRQAAMNVTVRNVITSMGLMSALDWAEFFESVSLVDEVLRAGSAFAAMDFATRDAYRHAIEDIARRSGRSELDVAREAVRHAGASAEAPLGRVGGVGDGAWYRRAYFDDGTPLGSAANDACRIDSIAQSWSVISGAAEAVRARRAMAAVDEHLVRRDDRLVLLLTPPFDDTRLEPGYIKGYLPGVRENGGQYTHAAVWSVIAFAALGEGDRAAELFVLLNPITHAATEAGRRRYKVEPNVMAGDVYAEPPHVGRGGWTWYTGSAGWMYRAGLESILGFRRRGPRLVIDPCIPRAWRSFEISFRHHGSRYDIRVENPRGVSRGVASVTVDGTELDGDGSILLSDDGKTHSVQIVLG